jgi:hypothetical protein
LEFVMKLVSLVAVLVPVLSLIGCAAPSGDSAEDTSSDELKARPTIELAPSSDKNSVQAELFGLLDAFKGDAALAIQDGIDSPALVMQGAAEQGVSGVRFVSCNSMKLVSATVGVGVSTTTEYHCSLEGFDKVRNGGSLPNVVLAEKGEAPLAGKLFSLLAKGHDKGGFGVKMSGGNRPPCCDIPTSTSYSLSDSAGTLSCTMHSGGFVFIQQAQCTYVANDAAKKPE